MTRLVLPSVLALTFWQQTTKPFVVTHFKNEPLEIVSVRLNGAAVQPNDRVTLDDLGKLEVTIKNVSEKDISYASAIVISPTDNREDIIPMTGFAFGSRAGTEPYLKTR